MPWTSDIWAEYARLKSLGWTQQRIAKAKNVDKATVSRRLRFNDMPKKVKEVVQHNFLFEWHLQELLELSVAQHLFPWLTTGQAWEELAEKAVHDRAKNGSKSREAFIYKLRLLGWTQKEIGEAVGITQQAVSEITSKLNQFKPLVKSDFYEKHKSAENHQPDLDRGCERQI